MTLSGIDVSRHQGKIDWPAVKAAGYTFAALKRTQGTSYTYQEWGDDNAPKAAAAGLVVGAYHFLTTFEPGAAQADYFCDVVGDFKGRLAVLDVETNPWNQSHPSAATAHDFARRFSQRTEGHRLVVYTGRWYWVGVLGNPWGADIGPLWHSEYDTGAEVADGPELDQYGGWDGCRIWQYTSSGSVPGIAGNVDLNLFYGDRADLASLTLEEDMPLTELEIEAVARRVWAFKIDDFATAGGSAADWSRKTKVAAESANTKCAQLLADGAALDEAAVAAELAPALLAVLTPQAIADLVADAVGPETAQAVVDLLAAKLNAPTP